MLAVFAFGALFVTVASAAETTLLAEWLWNNAAIHELLSVETSSTGEEGQILLEDQETPAGAAAVLCQAKAVGSVGENGEDEITEITAPNGRKISETLGTGALLGTGVATGEGSECKAEHACAEGSASSPIEVVPLGLPWHTLLMLDEPSKKFLVLLFTEGRNFGYELLCLVLLINTKDTCTQNDTEFEVVNDPEDVAIPANTFASPLATCSQSGGKATGVNEADTLTFILPLSGLLSVSSEA